MDDNSPLRQVCDMWTSVIEKAKEHKEKAKEHKEKAKDKAKSKS